MKWIPAVQCGQKGRGPCSFRMHVACDATGRKEQVGDPGQDPFQCYIPLVSAFRETVSSGTSIRGASDHSLSRS